MSPPYQPALFESSLPKWLACTDELAAGIQHHPRQKALKRAYIDPNPSALVWAMVFDVDRPEAATAWQDAPYGVPSAQLGHPEPRNGHAHLGYVLASPVSRTLKARATPQRFLARIQHGLTMALDADRAYTHRLTKTPDHPTWRTFWERPDPYELGSYVTTLATVCRCVSHDWKRWGGEERHAVRWPAEVGISSTVGLLGLAPVGACLSLPR